MYSNFDYSLKYKKEIKPLIDELMKKCAINQMPMFVSVCTKCTPSEVHFENNSSEIIFENNMITGYRYNYKMPKGQDLIRKFADVVNGFSVIPPTDEMEVSYDENYQTDLSSIDDEDSDFSMNFEDDLYHDEETPTIIEDNQSQPDDNFEIEFEDENDTISDNYSDINNDLDNFINKPVDDDLNKNTDKNEVVVEQKKRGRGRPKGSKNKNKNSNVISFDKYKDIENKDKDKNNDNTSLKEPEKKKRGRPKGSKNKIKNIFS